jgi:hypothetical protein
VQLGATQRPACLFSGAAADSNPQKDGCARREIDRAPVACHRKPIRDHFYDLDVFQRAPRFR